MTGLEVQDALQASMTATKVGELTGEIVEITTDFTLGQAVADAADELAAFLQSQVECATVTLEDATLTIDFGSLDDACSYNGHTYAGVAVVTVERAAEADVLVHHEWIGLTNGEITLDGSADVAWTLDDATRQVDHDVLWSDAEHSDVHSTGSRLQSGIDGDWMEGIVIDGERAWTVDGATYALSIDAVQWRWDDPVPESGAYGLTIPSGKHADLWFERVDEDTIAVTLEGGRRTHIWHVSRAGVIEEQPA
jgi:hypothetical protein